MSLRVTFNSWMCRLLRIVLAVSVAIAPSASVSAQTNAAAQAVRGAVDNLGRPVDGREVYPEGGYQEESARGRMYAGDRTLAAGSTAGMIDTTYVSPTAIALVVLRPAQIMAAPMAELLPKEVATAAGMQYLGVDPANVEEIVLFVGQINMMGPSEYGLTVKFNAPFRAATIPPQLRPQAQLSELAGKRYLQSMHPMMPSFYGPNNRTLVAAPDATLRRLVESRDQPKVGPLLDRARSVPAGSDLYVAIDAASLRPFAEMGVAQAQASGKVPAQATKFLEIPKLVSAVELTFNMSAPGPSSLVVHANDDEAASRLETLITEATNQYEAGAAADQSTAYDPVSQAMAQYKERMTQPFRPQRVGTSITLFQIDGQNPAHQQLVNVAMVGLAAAATMPAFQAARQAAQAAEAPPEAGQEQPADFQQPLEGQEFSR